MVRTGEIWISVVKLKVENHKRESWNFDCSTLISEDPVFGSTLIRLLLKFLLMYPRKRVRGSTIHEEG